MPVYYVTGTTGGGKGTYAVMKIQQYLNRGCRVATNVDLWLEHITDKKNLTNVTRLPDKPNFKHLHDLGMGSSLDNKNKHQYGLLVLDEISLFLDSKQSKEFKDLMSWLVQRRKLHWDIIFIAQSKDQVQETVYKSLCDNLVICKAKDLVPIPFLAPLLRFFGLKGMLPEGHVSFMFSGRSENDKIIKVEEYKNHPYRKMYNTDQVFTDGEELVGTQLLDMRASYSYLPYAYLSLQKFIDFHNQQIFKINNIKPIYEKGKKVRNNIGSGIAFKMKIFFLIALVAVVIYFNNPVASLPSSADDNIVITENQPESIPFISEVQKPLDNTDILENEIIEITEPFHYVFSLFDNYTYEVNGIIVLDDNIKGSISFKSQNSIKKLLFSDFNSFGFKIEKVSTSIILSHSSSDRLIVIPLYSKELEVLPNSDSDSSSNSKPSISNPESSSVIPDLFN